MTASFLACQTDRSQIPQYSTKSRATDFDYDWTERVFKTTKHIGINYILHPSDFERKEGG